VRGQEERPVEPICRIKWVEPQIADVLLRMALEGLASGHHLDGWAAPGPQSPVFFFRVATAKPTKPEFFPWGWDSILGATLTVTAFMKEGSTRICVYPRTTVFEQLQAGRFLAVFLLGSSVISCWEVDLSTMSGKWGFENHWKRVRNHAPVLSDHRAHYWECLKMMDLFSTRLTPSDNLSLGWIERYQTAVSSLGQSVTETQTGKPLNESGKRPPEEIADFVDAVSSGDLSVVTLMSHISAIQDQGDEAMARFINSQSTYLDYCHGLTGHTHCGFLSELTDTFFLSSSITDEGRRVPWIDDFGGWKIDFVDLRPTDFPKFFQPQDYWKRLSRPILPNLGSVLTGVDVPLDLSPASPEWNSFPVAEDDRREHEMADSLIDEAFSSKKWTIPNGAILKLRVGPFAHFQIWERDGFVAFLARSERGEFALLYLNSRERNVWFDGINGLHPEKSGSVLAALKLLLSAIVRDFHVVEVRESIFSVAREKRSRVERLGSGDPVTVYLPRVKYVHSANVNKCRTDLGHQERRTHVVHAHLRKADSASAHQLILASRYGFDVPKGYTFVRAHDRGGRKRDVIYRSRSALSCLYRAVPPRTGMSEEPSDWFRFERDVQTLMKRLGFEVEHVAASRTGDQGVDVYARKGADLDEICWVIQCKCYGPKNKVGPGAVRELIGTLQAYPSGTRGMLVTTSSFSSGARTKAWEANIRLMDGAEFSHLLDANS
jgi:hypothetical protein